MQMWIMQKRLSRASFVVLSNVLAFIKKVSQISPTANNSIHHREYKRKDHHKDGLHVTDCHYRAIYIQLTTD